MAAVAQALSERSFTPERISFFPGHGGKPGTAASEQVRHWWRSVARFFAGLGEVTWRDGSQRNALLERLRQATARLCHCRVLTMEDVGAGQWRTFAYSSEDEWPAVAARFERAKSLCTAENGARVLWKFTGLGAFVEPALTAAEIHSKLGNPLSSWTPRQLGAVLEGFAATSWVEGRRLRKADAADSRVNQRPYRGRQAKPAVGRRWDAGRMGTERRRTGTTAEKLGRSWAVH